MASLRLDKPWTALDAATVAAVPGQLGVYQLADADEQVVRIGYAGGTELFGLRSALARELETDAAASFRVELTHGYLSRWQELLMLHVADHGALPPGNADDARHLGRLSPSR